ncbi:hypothetical protein RVR_P1116 (plasmid) [Actinacidiphila reveromycinica]|uniref:Uncharacterized protein n=1 Tax=Actinacidiphila reveromycinica TaxID=659352 RepID=A0A7R6QDX2_9ACTN|nr:hypothetical protein [Streptomyces sp. SN-593]BBG20731.1 hypothetical protein RVR_P1116 [Streptomyces sp. SN-593]
MATNSPCITSTSPPPPTFLRKQRTVLSYGLGADSTDILLRYLADPAGHGLEPDLSDLVVVHAVTGDEWPTTLDYVNRLVLPRLRAANVRLVQIARGGPHDADGVLILSDSRATERILSAGPWRLSDELTAAGTIPQLANGRRTCSIRFKGWCLDNWAESEFGNESYRRVIGYHYGELGRAEKDSAIQRKVNAEAGRTICEPHYPLILACLDRAAIEAHVLQQLGEPIQKSYCTFCVFSGVCASRDVHEERLRGHPHLAADVLRMEHVSMALNENMAMYGGDSLYRRLSEDGRNTEIMTAFEQSLDQARYAVYEVRRIIPVGRTKDCKTWHGPKCTTPRWWCRQERTTRCRRHHGVINAAGAEVTPTYCDGPDGCRGPVKKGQAWRSLRTLWEGDRATAQLLVRRYAQRHGAHLERGELSGIERAHYVKPGDSYPSTAGYLVAAPAGAVDKQRPRFETKWSELTGRKGTSLRPLRPLPQPVRRRNPGRPPVRRARTIAGVTLIA